MVKLDRVEGANVLVHALRAGGLPCPEITLHTDAGLPAIEHVASSYPDVLVGAGTVIDADQARRAIEAGSRFVVSPGLDPEIVTLCQSRKVPIFPGIATPTDVMAVRKLGRSIVKFFPAEALSGHAVHPDQRDRSIERHRLPRAPRGVCDWWQLHGLERRDPQWGHDPHHRVDRRGRRSTARSLCPRAVGQNTSWPPSREP